jgi:hypothetical protein
MNLYHSRRGESQALQQLKESCTANSPAEVHVLNTSVHNRAIYFPVSSCAAQSLQNRDLCIAVLRAGKSVQITGQQPRVTFVNYHIMDYYFIHAQIWFALLGFRGVHSHVTTVSSVTIFNRHNYTECETVYLSTYERTRANYAGPFWYADTAKTVTLRGSTILAAIHIS